MSLFVNKIAVLAASPTVVLGNAIYLTGPCTFDLCVECWDADPLCKNAFL